MSREILTLKELGLYLKLTEKEIMRRVSNAGLPGKKVGGVWRFRKIEVDDWLQQSMQGLSSDRLSQIEHGVSQEKDSPAAKMTLSPLLKREALCVSLQAKTKASVLNELVELADSTGLVYDPDSLKVALKEREELCSTALEKGVATPHARSRQPWVLSESLVVVALHSSGLPFGGVDGALTDIFFAPLCMTDKEHLQVLARICRIVQERDFLDSLREADSTGEMASIISRSEKALVESWTRKR